jgi:hypothetical protein
VTSVTFCPICDKSDILFFVMWRTGTVRRHWMLLGLGRGVIM